MSQLLEEKFKILASGEWSEAIFKRLVGSEAQKRRMKVPIRAMQCSKLFVLWQIGIGIYDDLDTVAQLVISNSRWLPGSSLSYTDNGHSLADRQLQRGMNL